ncbi:unnamed protein product [Prunus armeniaca]
MSKVPYASAVGCLMYAMVCICLDLAQATTKKDMCVGLCGFRLYGALRQEEIYYGLESGTQSVCTLSTTEAEYMVLTEASKEAICLRRLAKELGVAQDLVAIQSDSQSVICLVKNQVNDGEIAIENVHTNDNASDCLTKPVTTEKFNHCLSLLNLVAC